MLRSDVTPSACRAAWIPYLISGPPKVHLEGELLGEADLFEPNWIDLCDLSDYPALLVARELVDLTCDS